MARLTSPPRLDLRWRHNIDDYVIALGWSPDGSELAFLAPGERAGESHDKTQIFVMRLDGGEARQLTEVRSLYIIKAPVDGTVLGLDGVFEGSYVQSGQRIGDISPTSDCVIDVSVPPKDIGRISKGQPVYIQVEAYPYTVWGLLPGHVIRISADYVQENDTTSAFRVVVRPDRDFLETREGLRGVLKKGMTVNARFLVARRSLWELLYQSLDQIFNPVMSQERLDRNQTR